MTTTMAVSPSMVARRLARGLRSSAGLEQMAIAQSAGLFAASLEEPSLHDVHNGSFDPYERAIGCIRGSSAGRRLRGAFVLPLSGDNLAPIALPGGRDSRESIRRAIHAESDETLIALLPGPDGSLDARWFGFVVGVLRLAHGSVRGVISEGAWDRRRSHLLHRVARTTDPLIFTSMPISRAVGSCDIALVDPTGIMLGAPARYLGACAAMIAGACIAGVPPVMHGQLSIDGVIPDGVRGDCVLKSRGASRVVELLHTLCADASFRREVGSACIAEWNAERAMAHNRSFYTLAERGTGGGG